MKLKTGLFSVITGICSVASAQNIGIGTTSPTDQLHTTGTVRLQNYSGIGTRLLYADSTGKITTAPGGTVYGNNNTFAIPDNGCSTNTGITSVINISGAPATISTGKISVRLGITHISAGDLAIFLFAPGGSIICLTPATGSGGSNFSGTIYTDEAQVTTNGGTAPYSGRYKPYGLYTGCALTATAAGFASIGGGTINPNGNWALKIFDNSAGNTGTLDYWQISFDGKNGFGTAGADGPVAYFSNGSLALSNITNTAAGQVGINTNTPAFDLDVNGTIHSAGGASFAAGLTAAGTTTLTGALNANSSATVAGNTSIGGTLQVAGGSPAAGRVLTASNGTGSAAWASLPATNTGFNVFTASSGTISLGNNATLIIPYNNFVPAATFDDGNNFLIASYSYKAPAAGVYMFTVLTSFLYTLSTQAGGVFIKPLLNGGGSFPPFTFETMANSPNPISVAHTFIMKLAANDLVSVQLGNSSGNTIIFSSTVPSQFEGVRLY